jgi:hypothetical protein
MNKQHSARGIMGFRQVASALIAQVHLAARFAAVDPVCGLYDSCHVFSPLVSAVPQPGQVYTLRRIDHTVSKLAELESLSIFS